MQKRHEMRNSLTPCEILNYPGHVERARDAGFTHVIDNTKGKQFPKGYDGYDGYGRYVVVEMVL